ncbi:hypothetical protein OIDMADRAFT_146875 [Oidiodendron maius Zn]|uniref:ABC transporter n=1 Tax=Oidiodendron maius (strain Zn) TaxID=913774 RepID=A0A0C3GTN1_OIDMZ|nr:hypothetical protein OIDMADRAFT_146875 [Oidiodendron maius Zn]
MECLPSADNTFGPQYCNHFDFTLLFEQSFFQIAPCALLLLLLPLRASQLRRQNVKTLRTGMQTVKQSAILVLAATQLALLVVWGVTPLFRTKASIPAALLSFLASLALLYLSSIEHTRSARPSSIINAYIFFSILFDIPQARTLWLRLGWTAVPGIFTAGLAAKTIVFYLEARNKRRSLLPPYQLYAPEALANLYDRIVMWWLSPLFMKGYGNIISIDGLFPIDNDLSSDRVERSFYDHWKNRSPSAKRPLLRATGRALQFGLITMAIPRLFLSAFRLSQPLLISRVTSWLSENDSDVSNGYGLIGATALVYVGMALTNVMSKRQFDRFSTKLRGALISVIHSKSLCLPADRLSNGAVLTLISNDVNRVCTTLQQIVDLFTTPIEIVIAIYLLEREIGVACIGPVIFSLIISLVSFLNSNRSIPLQKKWLFAIQERVAYTAAVLGCPKGFKMLGLTGYLRDRIQELRVAELNEYAQYRKFVTFRNAFAAIPDNVAPPLTMMMFTLIHGGSTLTPSVAFTSLSLVSLLTKPIQEIIFAVPSFITAMASVDRIEAFILLDGGELILSTAVSNMHQPDVDGVELSALTAPADRTSVRLEEVTVRLGKENETILDNISLAVLSGTLNFIVGPIGSGKSTLLRTIIGDAPLARGRRILPTKDVGFCSQEPWLPNETIRKIILRQSELDHQWYATVVQACALTVDIAALPAGENTVIGNKGVSLSGGQKQRLAVARALYSRKKLLVLDDIFSGLDARSVKHIFDHVLGPEGLCKKHGITAVMATHTVQYLHHADHIIALTDGGKVVEQGSFEALDSQNGYVHNLKLSGEQQRHDEQDINAAAPKSEPVITQKPDNDADQELARRTGDPAVYRYYARFPELWAQWWSEAEVSGDERHPLGVWIGVYILISALAIVCLFSQIWVMLVWSVPKSSAKLHQQLLDSVMNAPYSFFVHTDSGVTLNRFANDMSLIELQLADAVMHTQNGVCLCIASAILIAAGARYVGVIMPFVVILLYLLQKFYLRTSRQLRFMDLEAQAPLLTHCQETLTGVTTIRAFGWQESSHTTCLELLDRSQRPYYLMLCIQRWLNLVLDLTTAIIATVVVAFAMTLHGTASAGSVGLSLLNILNFNSQLSQLILDWTSLETSLGAVARCRNFETTTPSEHLKGETIEPPSEWPSSGQMTLSNLTASYVEGGASVLQNVSLSIPAGAKVGICGRSGSGKSSLLLALFRMLELSSGQMMLDGLDLATLPRATIRAHITAIPQDTLSVPGTVRANLDPLKTCTPAAISNALAKVGLSELIDERGGIDAEMNDLGLSQGETQLFAVARALLRPSKLLIVDEMTSAVDAATEMRMLDLIRTEFKESTVIAVAHRLRTIVNFDMIVVMDAGKIVEYGPPTELLENNGGWFKAMWQRG